MLLNITNRFVKNFRNHEKNLVEMVLTARKKRDLHKRLMVEADKKAKKEAMIQMLLKNKMLLYQYIMANEKQMTNLSRKIQQTSHQLHSLKYENMNLKSSIQHTMRRRKGTYQEQDNYLSDSSDKFHPIPDNLFSRFFNAIKKVQQ